MEEGLGWSRMWARLRPLSAATQHTQPLDGLRGVAVLLIVMLHVTHTLTRDARGRGWTALGLMDAEKVRAVWGFGATGVSLFFVLSGFLLFMPYARRLFSIGQQPSPTSFYRKRALRILPGYWTSLLLIVILIAPGYIEKQEKWPDVIKHFLLIHNFDPTTFGTINPVYWSMAIEVQFYLLLPLVAAGLVALGRRGRWGWLTTAIVAGLLASPLYSWLTTLIVWPTQGFTIAGGLSLARYFGSFALGIAASILYIAATEAKVSWLPAAQAQRLGKIAGLVGATLYLAFILLNVVMRPGDASKPSDALNTINYFFREPIMAICYSGLLLGVILGWPRWARALSGRFLIFIGGVSYSLYLWNEPITRKLVVPLALQMPSEGLAILAAIGLTMLVTLPLAFIFYTLIERPFIRIRLRQQLPAPAKSEPMREAAVHSHQERNIQ